MSLAFAGTYNEERLSRLRQSKRTDEMNCAQRPDVTLQGSSNTFNGADREIFEACRDGDIRRVKKLVTAKNANARDSIGRRSTPLHFAAGFGRKEVVTYLISMGASVGARDEGGLVPLHNACSFGHAAVTRLLIKSGADPNALDHWGFSPLHEAALKGKVDVCIALLQSGANPNVRNLDGKTPLDLADSNSRAVLTGEYRKDELLEAARSGNEELLMSLLTPLNVNIHADDGRKSTPLHLAAGYNRTQIVKLLLQYFADVHVQDKGGLVPLHNACSYGHLEVTELLIKYGANVNALDLWQFSPLHEAASKGRIDVCSCLLAHGADPTVKNSNGKTAIDLASSAELRELLQTEYEGHCLLDACHRGDLSKFKRHLSMSTVKFRNPYTGENALHILCNASPVPDMFMVKAVVAAGVNVNERNKNLLSPLHIAADRGCIELINLLIENGANVNLLDGLGQTSLHRCTKLNLPEACKLLLDKGVDASIVNLHGLTACQLATGATAELIGEHPAVVSKSTRRSIERQMLEASKAGDLQSVKRIVQHSADSDSVLNCRDVDGRNSTPLHFAAGYNRFDVVKFLVESGANLHARDKGGLEPLHNACSYGHYEVTDLLIKNGADVNACDLWKFTPLHEAAANGKFDICKLLLAHGADCSLTNRDGETPLDLVKDSSSDVADLLRGDVAILEAAKRGEVDKLRKLVTADNVNCHDVKGRNSTPLHLAAGYNNYEAAEFLIEKGADVNAKDRGGLIPLHNAASYGHFEIGQLLVQHGAQANAQDLWGFTPLHEASQKGRFQLVTFLLSHGADPTIRNHDNQIPLDLATAEDVRILLQDAMPASYRLNCPQVTATEEEGNACVDAPGMSTSNSDSKASNGTGEASSPRSWLHQERDKPLAEMDVPLFLKSVDLECLQALFKKEQITMDVLVEMSQEDLKAIGLTTYGIRRRLMRSIEKLTIGQPVGCTMPGFPPSPSGSVGTVLVPLARDHIEFMAVEDEMQSTIVQHQSAACAGGLFFKYSVVKVDKVFNRRLWEKYIRRRDDVAEENSGQHNEKLLFHGSPFVHAIVQKGFDERHAYIGGMFGAGIYFAEHSSKSNQYVHGIGGGTGCLAHKDKSCYVCLRYLLLCRVTLGKTFVHSAAMKLAHAPPGHHSILGRPSTAGLAYPEYVIYRGEQAYPEYLITYQIVKPADDDCAEDSSCDDQSRVSDHMPRRGSGSSACSIDEDLSSSESEEEMNVSIDFVANYPTKQDANCIAAFLGELFPEDKIDLTQLALEVSKLDSVGSVFRFAVDDTDEQGRSDLDKLMCDTLLTGVVSAIQLSRSTPSLAGVVDFLIEKCNASSAEESTKETCVQLLESCDKLLFLLNERLNKMPPKMAAVALNALLEELEKAKVEYNHVVTITKPVQTETRDGPNCNPGQSGASSDRGEVYPFVEELQFELHSDMRFDYEYVHKEQAGSASESNEQEDGEQFSRVIIMKKQEFVDAVGAIHGLYCSE
uniref:Poly [ADP-ribose] polymerase n=1 Tax=Trichuris muris TaxID=70415 RepID=A0A5S6QKX3_TRIMR